MERNQQLRIVKHGNEFSLFEKVKESRLLARGMVRTYTLHTKRPFLVTMQEISK